MVLSPASPRKPIHVRSIQFQGYLREDGLWDIEAQLLDTRSYAYLSREKGLAPVSAAVHEMLLRVTLDDRMTIQAIESGMPTTPFRECSQAADPLQKLVGARLGRGWRRTIDEAMGGVQGCTHLRELLFNLATAAFQTIPVYRSHLARLQGVPLVRANKPLPHFGQCLSWDFHGPVMNAWCPSSTAGGHRRNRPAAARSGLCR